MADFGKEVLVVVCAGAADEEHGEFAFTPRTDVGPYFPYFLQFLGDDFLDPVDERLVLEVGPRSCEGILRRNQPR